MLRLMLSPISGMMFEMMPRSHSDPSSEPGVPHHPQILAAIEEQDVEGSRAAMREHLALGLRTYGPSLDMTVDVMAKEHIEQLLRR